MLKTAIQNLQAIGQYYEFSDVDVDRYRIGGALRQVMISAREVDPRNLDASAQTWVNLYLAYTHGYGVVAAQVNRAETSGRPAFVVSGFDQQRAAIPVRQPRIYFGEPPPDTPSYVVVGSRQPEVGSPSVGGDSAASFRYDGRGGVQLSSPLRRLAAAVHFTDLNLLISSNLNGRSRILFNRDVRDRVEKAAPFLQWDADPYVAVVDGRVVFVRDGYTTTDNFPYSQRIQLDVAARRTDSEDRGVHGEANYIRNSVKAVVDAYDGTTTLYVFDETDPLLRAWRKAFPNLFAPRRAMSRELQAHLRYPEDLFSIQTDRYASYHIGAARDFYSKQDFWALPEDRSGQLTHGEGSLVVAGPKPRMRPYYLLTRLPGERDEQFVLVMPFTPNNKQNMVAYMAARSDPPATARSPCSASLARGRCSARPRSTPRSWPTPRCPRNSPCSTSRAPRSSSATCSLSPSSTRCSMCSPSSSRPARGDPGAATSPSVLQQPTRLHRQPRRLDRPSAQPDHQHPAGGRRPAGATADAVDGVGADPPAAGRRVPPRPAGPRPPRPRRLPAGHRAPRPAHPTGAATHRDAAILHDRPGGQSTLTNQQYGRLSPAGRDGNLLAYGRRWERLVHPDSARGGWRWPR